MIPQDLGGGALPHSEMCHFIHEMSRDCSSTALAFAMHQQLIAASIWNYRRGNPGEKLLRRVVEGELVLVSTGATDWLSSTGALHACEGGFRYSGSKRFASGAPAGDLLITSGRFHDPEAGWQVLHFPLSFRAEGVRVENDWKTMGMRGTGSNTVTIENAFVPADSISLRRAPGVVHSSFAINTRQSEFSVLRTGFLFLASFDSLPQSLFIPAQAQCPDALMQIRPLHPQRT